MLPCQICGSELFKQYKEQLSFGLQYRIDVVGEAPDFETEHPQFESLINEILLQNGFKTNFQPSFNGSEDVTYMLKK